MKIYKKILTAFICGALIVGMLGVLAACGFNIFDNDIANTVDTAVTFPDQYSITYEVETVEGVVRTVKKAVDADGNIYFKSSDKELLFIKNDELYTLYTKDSDGNYQATSTSEVYNQTYVDTETAAFLSYAEQSKKQFIPGMESTGEETVIGRTCYVYGVKLGSENNGVSYSFYVDKETGICLGFESNKSAAGVDLGSDGEVFRCTEFITENVESLKNLLPTESTD